MAALVHFERQCTTPPETERSYRDLIVRWDSGEVRLTSRDDTEELAEYRRSIERAHGYLYQIYDPARASQGGGASGCIATAANVALDVHREKLAAAEEERDALRRGGRLTTDTLLAECRALRERLAAAEGALAEERAARQRAVEEAVAAEREACARAADDAPYGNKIAAAIRSRSGSGEGGLNG